jgi:hypothetical protein
MLHFVCLYLRYIFKSVGSVYKYEDSKDFGFTEEKVYYSKLDQGTSALI